MATKLITAPILEPLTLTQAKEHLRVDYTDDDTYITALITVARRYCENYQNRAYITQTWEVTFDSFPQTPFDVPKPPLQSITSIKYYDTTDTENTYSSSNYYVDTYSQRGRVSLNHSITWPGTTLRPINGVIVRFIAGYGALATDVPNEVIHAMKILIAEWYENRTPIGDNMPISERSYKVIHTLLYFDRVVPT
jgi:uncharacterized phiE125 gp8 family phage protein